MTEAAINIGPIVAAMRRIEARAEAQYVESLPELWARQRMNDDQVSLFESLITHPGWKAYEAHVQQEWGPAGLKFQAELEKALNLADNNASASQARQILSGQKVITALMRWPYEELAKLKRQHAPIEGGQQSRRGSL